MGSKPTTAKPTLKQKWRELFLSPGSDPTRTITRAYILALGVIAFLTISIHIITAHITEQQKESAETAYHIGRQRTLMQQIMLYATNYQRIGEALDYDFMMQSLWELEKGHEFITSYVDDRHPIRGHRSEELYRIYFKPPFNLDEQLATFIAQVKEYATFPAVNRTEENYEERRKQSIERLTYLSNNILRPAMDAALENYQTETVKKISFFYTIQFAGAMLIVLVLVLEAIFIFRPLVNRIKKYNAVMKRYALEDSLTGLNNRRAFMNAAVTELKKARREKTPLSVALMDLDYFKKINDTYGHEVGDKVLQHFAGILKQALRAGDITGRIGGEEFAIILPKIDSEGAQKILQRFCETVANTPLEYEAPGGARAMLNYTVSIGYTGPALIEEQTIDSLLARADESLYAAKERGRNGIMNIDQTATDETT